ncbi:AAEL001397-PA [Aedes aegypti]|uniref:DIS3-like exonuclease 2 n=1 Tax=Aedes aegypti TaxID=7159 RepID=Q17L93_AEDAE|nr:AAEL001397-PA [Aedes aegypti]
MSDKEFLREIREEIKSSTTKMLQQSDPPPELKPLPDDQWLASEGPNATDPTEVDPGFEFVELVSADEKSAKVKSKDGKKATKKQQKSDASVETNSKKVGKKEESSPLSPEDLKKEISEKLEKVKEKLKVKKEICNNLDSEKHTATSNGYVEADDESGSVTSSQKSSKISLKVKEQVVDDSDQQKQYDEKTAAMKDRIKDLQNKIKTLSMDSSGPSGQKKESKKDNKKKKPDPEPPLKKADSTSTLSSASKPSKKEPKDKNSKEKKTPAAEAGAAPWGQHLPPQLTRPDNLLLLTLLTLDPKQRDDYLMKMGKERAMLVPSKKKSSTADKSAGAVQVTAKVTAFAAELKRAALLYCYGPKMATVNVGDISRPFITVQSVQEVKKVWEFRTFEEEVTYLLNNGKTTDKKDFKKELTLENVSKAEKNSFLTEQNKAALAELVERLVKDGVGYIVEGVVRINQNNNAQAFVDDNTREANVFINSVILRKCAMDGDYVKVFVKHGDPQEAGAANSPPSGSEDKNESNDENGGERQQNNRGFVIEILEKRHSRLCVGTFMPFKEKVSQSQYMKFAPRDMRMPFMRVYKQNWPEAIFKNDFKEIESVIYQAEIIEWHNDIPIANIMKSIGKCGELEVESQAILVEYDLDVSPYSEKILNSLPGSEFQIPEEELAKREDLRDECVFTIDPLTARDLDDALSCKILKNGNYEIGVHISDVSYFLREASELDELVKLRATSIYMVDGVYHMLPKSLCFLCSLLPGEDKLAFSVFWEITPDAKVLKTRFAKTVINSCTQLAYEHAQIMLDKPNQDLKVEDFPQIRHGYTPNYLSRIVNQLQSIAVQFRARRMANGNLKINQPKLSFSLDPNTGKPTDFAIYELRTANQMIEDFMLLANASVAEFTHAKFDSTSVLRNHFAPQDYQMKHLAKQLAKHGHSLRIDSSKAIAESVESIVDASSDPIAARAVLNIMIAKPMTRARYFCSAFASDPEEFHHFALAIPMYTHFTSPIRRYADCLVHRVLAGALAVDEVPTRSPDELSKLTGICNIKKYNAKLAGDASSLLYFKHYLKQRTSLEAEAAVLDIGPQQIELVLIETGHVIKTSYKQLSKSVDFKITEEAKPIRHCILISKEKKFAPTSLMLFSKVRVTVIVMKDALAIRTILPATVATEQNVADATVAMEEGDGAVAEAATTANSNAASTSIASDAEQDNASKATQPSES